MREVMLGTMVDDAPARDIVPFHHLLRDEMAICSSAQLDLAARMAAQTGTKTDFALVQSGAASQADRRDALSQHMQIASISLSDAQPDHGLCDPLDHRICLRLGFVPWQRLGQTIVLALHDPDHFDAILAEAHRIWPDLRVGLVLATPADVEAAITAAFCARIATAALQTCPERYSCRTWKTKRGLAYLPLFVSLLIILILFAPALVLGVMLGWILIANTATLALRLTAILSFRWANIGPQMPAPIAPEILPTISLLLPVLREDAVLPQLIRAIGAMEYPAAALDVLLLLEQDDDITRAALAKIDLPPWLRVIEVPPDTVRTKPRAMNYALPFCRGSIIGIYDAEDRPEPDQLHKVAARLHGADWQVGCVQARLDFYNPDQNWLTRCFTLEYATWFRVLLHGVQVAGIPLPLGGTSVFFRRAVLEEIGAWDAHNVTEDAELGMRLARYGYRCEMLDSVTHEEANSRYGNWIGQRSRWLKGYCMTWAAHMRSPTALLRDLGLRGFLGFQVLFLGAITAYLALPLFWIMTGLVVSGQNPALLATVPDWLWMGLWISLPVGQVVMLIAVALALRNRCDMRRMVWALTLPAYWPLGALAAWRAVVELFVAPFHWHKTQHGLTSEKDIP